MPKDLKTRRFVGVCLAVLGAAALLAMLIYLYVSVPAEDALILDQYSRNLAETGVISYVPHGLPAEGATDFLWMLLISLGWKMHVPIGITTGVLNACSLFGIAAILLRIAGRAFRIVPALAIIGVIALFPQYEAALKGFNVFPSAFALALTFLFVIQSKPAAASASALLMCLIRPDGIVIAAPLLLTLILFSPKKPKAILNAIAFFVVPGICYFLWRWHYFGLMFPLPFMVKAGFHRTWGLFVASSVPQEAPYFLFALLATVLIYGRRARSYQVALVASLFLIPGFFYINVALLQNLHDRYFYFFPLGVALLAAREWDKEWVVSKSKTIWTLAGFYVLAFLRPAGQGFFSNLYGIEEGKRLAAMATDLSHVQPHGTMLVTEAGLMPYYSRWVPVDAFGLNTPEFASHFIQPADVAALRPDLVIMHGFACPQRLVVSPAEPERYWPSMGANIFTGLAQSGVRYEIWKWPTWSPKKQARLIARGEGRDDECWLVREDFAGKKQVDAVLATHGGTEIDTEHSSNKTGEQSGAGR